MYKEYLMQERALLQKAQEHHVKELDSQGNPTGILLCQKHENSFRWVKIYTGSYAYNIFRNKFYLSMPF